LRRPICIVFALLRHKSPSLCRVSWRRCESESMLRSGLIVLAIAVQRVWLSFGQIKKQINKHLRGLIPLSKEKSIQQYGRGFLEGEGVQKSIPDVFLGDAMKFPGFVPIMRTQSFPRRFTRFRGFTDVRWPVPVQGLHVTPRSRAWSGQLNKLTLMMMIIRLIIIIHLLGRAPAGYLAASDNGA
jgi:hypothetical protein